MTLSKLSIFGCLLAAGIIITACSPDPTPTPTIPPTATAAVQITATRAVSPIPDVTSQPPPSPTIPNESTHTATPPATLGELADVLSVSVSGDAGSYTFSVQVSSPDEGCNRYADWWEVLSEDGELVYRRVLLHSHVGEQPFTRSGGPVAVAGDDIVIVRAHMNSGGYGGSAMQGSPSSGFRLVELAAGEFPNVENQPPLPTGCNF